MTNPLEVCHGCTACAMRCTDGVKLSEYEYARIVETLRALDPAHVHRILRQSKTLPWFEHITYTACLFHDTDTRRCLIYPARPLICRLFGLMPHLPCPKGRVTAHYPSADALLEAYYQQPLSTFPEWMAAHGVFDFDGLIGVPDRPRCIEI